MTTCPLSVLLLDKALSCNPLQALMDGQHYTLRAGCTTSVMPPAPQLGAELHRKPMLSHLELQQVAATFNSRCAPTHAENASIYP